MMVDYTARETAGYRASEPFSLTEEKDVDTNPFTLTVRARPDSKTVSNDLIGIHFFGNYKSHKLKAGTGGA